MIPHTYHNQATRTTFDFICYICIIMAKKPFTPIPPMAELPPAEEINVRELLDKYLTGEIDLICVLGPTASGKTRYAVQLAREINSLLDQSCTREVFLVAESLEDRATRGTEAGGPQAKRSGGVSEANVRDITSHGKQKDRNVMNPVSLYYNENK